MDKVVSSDNDVPLENINGFVACLYDSKCYVGCVLNVFEDKDKMEISFLQPHGPSHFRKEQIFYQYPFVTS